MILFNPFLPRQKFVWRYFLGFLGWFTHSWQRAAHSFHQLLDPSCFHGIFRRHILPNAPLPRTPRLEMIEWKLPKIYSTFNSDVFFSEFPWWLFSDSTFRFCFFGSATTLCRMMRSLWCCINCPVTYPTTTCAPMGCWKGGNFESIQHRSLPPKPSGFYLKWVRKPTQNSAKIGCHFKAEQ